MSGKKVIWGVVAIIIIILIVWAVQNKSGGDSTGKQTVKIGVIAPLTGGGAVFGQALVNGIKLAQEDLTNTNNVYELIIEDDGTNPAQSASAAQKLVNIDKVSAIITTTSGTGNAVKPIAVTGKVPHICVCADISVGDNAYNFTNSLIPSDEAAIYVTEAKKQGIKTAALWSQVHPGINAIMDALEPQLTAAGIQIVYKDRYDSSTRDFKTTIAKGQKTNPDTFFILAFPPTLDIIGQEFKNLGVTKISAVSAFGISANPGIFEGYWYTDPNLADLAFRERNEQTYPDARFNVRTAPYGYDTFNIIVQAVESGNDVSDSIKNITSYDGKIGHLTKDASVGNFRSPAAIWIIKDGRSEPVK